MTLRRYSRWDGTQKVGSFDLDEIMRQLGDDMFQNGDLSGAMRRLMRRGMPTKDGEPRQGLTEMISRLRQRRRELLDQHNLDAVVREVFEELAEILAQERAELDSFLEEAAASGDEARLGSTADLVGERHAQLDLLPDNLTERIQSLSQYPFFSSDARERFEQMVQRLTEQFQKQLFEQLSGSMNSLTPEDIESMKQMLADLNQMLDHYGRDEPLNPSFEEFMARHGHLFPENPQTFEELLEALAQRMAMGAALMNSLSPDQRAQLEELSKSLLGDMDLAWQLDQLGSNLRELFPQAGWGRSQSFRGEDPFGLAEASQAMRELSELDQLEQMLSNAVNPAELAEVDLDMVRRNLGDDSAAALASLEELAAELRKSGLIDTKEGRVELTAAGLRKLGESALQDIFRQLLKDRSGNHDLRDRGFGHEPDYFHKPYEFGDPFRLDLGATLRNAIRRGSGVPVRLSAEDFEIETVENQSRAATVLLLDLSLSMVMRDTLAPAKKMALALHTLITSKFPKDSFHVVGFSEVAHLLDPRDLPEVSFDGVYGTNMAHAISMARKLMGNQRGNKQILLVTDGEPTAHILSDGTPFFSYPPVPETIEETFREVYRATREGIRINTFMLYPSVALQRFVEQLSRVNGGRVFYATGDDIGSYVLVDFLESRQGGGRRAAGL